MLKIKNLSKIFGDIIILDNIELTIEKASIVGLAGPSGSGKSTLLKILSRVTSPSTGTIKTKGRIASLLEVGTGFHPEMTGRENIYLNGAILGMTKREIASKIDEIIAFSGCERYIDTPVRRYSSGMYVRLAFAVAAFLEPEILIVDEVCETGKTLFGAHKKMDKLGAAAVTSAVVHYKPRRTETGYVPDYYAEMTDAWIEYPSEIVDEMGNELCCWGDNKHGTVRIGANRKSHWNPSPERVITLSRCYPRRAI